MDRKPQHALGRLRGASAVHWLNPRDHCQASDLQQRLGRIRRADAAVETLAQKGCDKADDAT
jgi:hypothetical protein